MSLGGVLAAFPLNRSWGERGRQLRRGRTNTNSFNIQLVGQTEMLRVHSFLKLHSRPNEMISVRVEDASEQSEMDGPL